jgi:hypothetical protein
MLSFIINKIAVYEQFYVMYVLLEGKAAVRKKKTSVPGHANVIACSCRRNIAG